MKSDYEKTGDEPDYKRCAICDHCNLDGVKRKKFVFDRATDQYHCMDCAKEIQSAVTDDEFGEYDWTELKLPYWKRNPRKAKMDRDVSRINRVTPTLPEFAIWDEVNEEADLGEVGEDDSALSEVSE